MMKMDVTDLPPTRVVNDKATALPHTDGRTKRGAEWIST